MKDVADHFRQNLDALQLHDKQRAEKSKDDAGWIIQTISKMLHQLTQQKGASAPMQTAVDHLNLASTLTSQGSRDAAARALEAAVQASSPAVNAVELQSKTSFVPRKPYAVDGRGFKLTHLPHNDFDNFSKEVKNIYLNRDGVNNAAEYKRVAVRTCKFCDASSPNMPHDEIVCPLAYYAGLPAEQADAKVGKLRAAKYRARLHDNMDKLIKGGVADLYQIASELDHDDTAHQDAVLFFVRACGVHLAECTGAELIDDAEMLVLNSKAVASSPDATRSE